MRGYSIIFSRAVKTAISATLAAGLAALVAGGPASAQSAGSWTLPEPSGTPTASGAQGPVDGQNPVVRPRVDQAAPAQIPTITPPAPAPTPARTGSAEPAPRPAPAPVARPSAAPTTRPTAPAPSQAEAVAPSPTATPAPTEAAPEAMPEPQAAASEPPPVAQPTATPETRESWPFWWWAVPLALLAMLGAAIAFLRRSRPAPDDEDEAPPAPPEALAVPDPVPPAETAIAPAQVPAAVPQPIFAPAPAVDVDVELSFEPVGLRLSLVYATLQYRLAVTAGTDLPAGRLLGDMIGAHASIAPDEQLAPDPAALGVLKAFPPMAAGETVILAGEVQLPLGAIRPLQKGNASLFVPLVRLCLVSEGNGPALRRVYTVGLDGGGPGLSPLRLDTGPREHRELAAREVEAARAYPLQPADQQRAAG